MSTINEWNLLKRQFDALVHDEIVDADSLEKTLDDQVRRRFAEMINRAGRRPDVWPGMARELRDEPTLELLDKELWGVSPNPPLERGALGLTVLSLLRPPARQ